MPIYRSLGTGDTRAQIEAANAAFIAAFKRADADAMAAAYTADAELAPPHSDFVRGTAAIRAFWQGVIDLGLRDVQLTTADVEAHGAVAVELGRYTLLAPNGSVADRGKYLVVWKTDRGAWKLYRDIWTTSQPAAAA